MKEALTFEKGFDDATTVLLQHLRDKPECRDVIEELINGERERTMLRKNPTTTTVKRDEQTGTL